MVARTFLALDSAALLIDPSSPFGTPGSSVNNNGSTPNGTIFEFQSGFGRQSVTLDDTSGGRNVFNDGQPGGHTIIDGGGLVTAGTGVESESVIFLRALDDDGNQTGPTIRMSVFSQNGNAFDIWGFATDDFLSPGVRYEKVSGSNNGNSRYRQFVPCFVSGTLLRTPSGQTPIENLGPGDEVWTRSGIRKVRWIGMTVVNGGEALAPVRFAEGAIGNTRELHVSPQHRMLIEGKGSELLFSSDAVLIAAKHLVGLPGVERVPTDNVEYVHLMFDEHEIVEAEGCLSESFFPGDVAINALDQATRGELMTLFPNLTENTFQTAARCLRSRETAAMRAYLFC